MANAVTPAAPRARPSTVNLAVYLMYLLAALQILSLLVVIAAYSGYQEAFENTQGIPEGQAGTFAAIAVGVGGAIALVLAIAFLVLVIFVGRGSNVARIITWVFGAFAVCCVGYGVIGTATGASMGGGGGGVDPAELQRNMEASLPSWYNPAALTSGVITLLATIAVIILLALPASNAYFRKQPPEQTWEPPLPGSPYGPPA